MINRKIAGLILAAGESTRMGFPKPLCRYQGETFIGRIIRMHRQHALRTIVVLGFDAGAVTREIPRGETLIVINAQPEKGPLSSLQSALPLVDGYEALLLHPVDHPCVKANTIGRLLAAFDRLPASILIPEHRGHKGHPVLFPARFFPDLRKAPLDQGARAVTHRNRASVHRVAVHDKGICKNIDTPADLLDLRDERPGIWLRLDSRSKLNQ